MADEEEAAVAPPWGHGARRQRLGWLAAAFLAAFALRFGPHAVLSADGGVAVWDPDACLHLRRILVLMARGGTLPDWDAWSNFPEGHAPYFMPLLDWIAYGACRLLGIGAADEGAIAQVAACFPPLLGALTVVPVWGMARALFGPVAGTVAAFIIAVLPGHVAYSAYADIDHHVLEALFTATLVWVRVDEGPARARPHLSAALDAVCLYALALSWNGSALYMILFAGISLLAPWRSPGAVRTHGLERSFWTFAWLTLALAATIPYFYWYGHGEIRFDAPSLFHVLLSATCAASCGLGVLLLRRWGGEGPSRLLPLRRAALAAGVAVALAGAWILSPGPMGEALRGMPGFATMTVNRLNTEGHTLFAEWRWALHELTTLSVLIPGIAVWLGVRMERSGKDPEAAWTFVGWLLAALLLALRMVRFTYLLAPFLAVLVAGVADQAPASLGVRPARRAWAGALFVLLCLAPVFGDTWTIYRGRTVTDPALCAWFASLRSCTDDPGDWRYPERPPRYGILCPWSYGNQIQLWSRRATVSDNIGVGFDKEFRFDFATDVEAAYQQLRVLGVRYVVLAPDPLNFHEQVFAHYGAGKPQPFLRPLPDGSWATTPEYDRRVAIRLLTGDGCGAPGIAHFRLVAEQFAGPELRHVPELMKCLEVVAGARLRGKGAPGDSASARVDVHASSGRKFVYQTEGSVGAEGEFELTVPYGTSGATVPTAANGPYRVVCGARAAWVNVPEDDIVRGGTIEVRFDR